MARPGNSTAGFQQCSALGAIVLGFIGIVGLEGTVRAESLTVAAAPSLKAAFQEIVPMFEHEYGATVSVLYGPSPVLRREIEKGAPIDVFLPASEEEVLKLHRKGLTINGGPQVYAQTSLVLVTSTASPAMSVSFHEVLPNRAMRIALADPEKSALGSITARALAKLDAGYKRRFNLFYAQHGEDVVQVVRSGLAEVGIVYRVDAINSGQVRIIDEAPAGAHVPVRFGEAVVWTCREESMKVAEEFFDFIASPRIQKLLLKYGFDPVPSKN